MSLACPFWNELDDREKIESVQIDILEDYFSNLEMLENDYSNILDVCGKILKNNHRSSAAQVLLTLMSIFRQYDMGRRVLEMR